MSQPSSAPVERSVPQDQPQDTHVGETIDLDKARAAIDAERLARQQQAAQEIQAICEKYGVQLQAQANITLSDLPR